MPPCHNNWIAYIKWRKIQLENDELCKIYSRAGRILLRVGQADEDETHDRLSRTSQIYGHFGAVANERTKLARDFNNAENPIVVFVLLVDDSIAGLNLHKACNVVFITAPGPDSWQAVERGVGRVHSSSSFLEQLKVLICFYRLHRDISRRRV